jgi:hypothetical protein
VTPCRRLLIVRAPQTRVLIAGLATLAHHPRRVRALPRVEVEEGEETNRKSISYGSLPTMITISGKSKAEVLRRLYNAARTKQTRIVTVEGKRVKVPKEITLRQAQAILDSLPKKEPIISTLGDRELHVDLRGEEFDETQYDNKNGWGTAEKALSDP